MRGSDFHWSSSSRSRLAPWRQSVPLGDRLGLGDELLLLLLGLGGRCGLLGLA